MMIGAIGFHIKAENEGFAAADLPSRQNLKYEHFMSLFGRLRQKKCTKERAVR